MIAAPKPLTLDTLRDALAGPGAPTSDFDLNPGVRPNDLTTLRPAAVLVAFLPDPRGLRVVLTKRASGLKHHPGQVAFPGGKVDPTDADAQAAALREAEEEVGLRRASVEVFASLAPHTTVTGFEVTPVLGAITGPFTPVAEAGEVAEVFTVPLSHLAAPRNYLVQSRHWSGVERFYYTVPWGPYYIWGATARMLRALAERLEPTP